MARACGEDPSFLASLELGVGREKFERLSAAGRGGDSTKMSSEVKQRKKPAAGNKQGDAVKEQNVKGMASEEPGKKPEPECDRRKEGSSRRTDLRSGLFLLSLIASAVLAGAMFQQSANFADLEQKYQQLYTKSLAAQALGDEVSKVSKKCESAQEIMDKLKDHSLLKQVENLQAEIRKMKIWSTSITDKRNELDEKLVSLSDTIERIEKSTAQISNDVTTKLSSVRTDIRRISGLDSDISLLKDSLHELETKVTSVEKTAIHNIGDLIATSVDRVTQLKNLVSRNTDKIVILQKKLTELKAEDDKLSDRIFSLENSRAKLLKAVMFANDLKPKIFNLKKDFSLIEPQMNDIIGRIGRISSDLQKRNVEIVNLRKEITNCTVNSNENQGTKDQQSQVTAMEQ
ncbi:inhibitor of nuclear factor kappa-B kinase-interacting protein isoform X1 [Amblyraja radiata]|uniref:inhibitor of nuclear factor kappa-B kinase-interacting protein isoform X1 n=1 Tax=Amblyraja radiata TaxID=386614 RepID=UPI001402E176|nr:inhibitor of nuclear factor kappa-B kinase-interacting protein isoform X1 [Amblyraja radiata]